MLGLKRRRFYSAIDLTHKVGRIVDNFLRLENRHTREILRMRRVRDRAGIKPDDNGENLVMYTNRHTLLTQAARNGANGPQLQLLGGWTSLQMADRYVHLAETDTYEAGLRAIQGLQPQRSVK